MCDAESVSALLRNKGLRPTYPRILITRYLSLPGSHPTADEIYSALKGDIASLSKTTVYNTLSALREKGVVNGVVADSDQTRYEINLRPHGHFKCIRCGEILDVETENLPQAGEMIEGNRIVECSVIFRGYCASCLEKT